MSSSSKSRDESFLELYSQQQQQLLGASKKDDSEMLLPPPPAIPSVPSPRRAGGGSVAVRARPTSEVVKNIRIAQRNLKIYAATLMIHFGLQIVYLSVYHSTYDGSWYDGDGFHFLVLMELLWWPLFTMISMCVVFAVMAREDDTNNTLRIYMVYTWGCASVAAVIMIASWLFTNMSPTCSGKANRACACDSVDEQVAEQCVRFAGRQVRWTWMFTLAFRSANWLLLVIISFTAQCLVQFNEEIRSLFDRLEISTMATRKRTEEEEAVENIATQNLSFVLNNAGISRRSKISHYPAGAF